MKQLLLVFCLLIGLSAFAQRDKEIQIRAGVGAAGYLGDSQITIFDGNNTYVFPSDSGGVTTFFPVELRYELHPRFNFGLDMKFGKYLYDPDDDNSGKSNHYRTFGLSLEGVIVNRNNFRFHLGANAHTTRLVFNDVDNDSNDHTAVQSIWRGGGLKFYTGVLVYFGNSPLGFIYNMGYDSHNLKLKDVTINNSSNTPFSFSGSILFKGIDANIGLVFRIR